MNPLPSSVARQREKAGRFPEYGEAIPCPPPPAFLRLLGASDSLLRVQKCQNVGPSQCNPVLGLHVGLL